MNKRIQDKINQTVDYIEKDKILPDNPFFFTRLVNRMESNNSLINKEMRNRWGVQVKPVLISLYVIVFISSGILLGNLFVQQRDPELLPDQIYSTDIDVDQNLFFEINGFYDEQLLLLNY